MTVGEQARWWGIGFIVFVVFMWVFSGVITPFIAGAALAYFLDPLADRLEARGLSRALSTTIIGLVMLAIGVVALIIIVPLLLDQAKQIVETAPVYAAALRDWISTVGAERAPNLFAEGSVVMQNLGALQEQVRDWSLSLVKSAWSSGLALIDYALLLVVTPVVAFYLLLDWDNMVAEIDGWLPRQHKSEIRRIAREIDRVLAGFVRGQISVCLILGTFYAAALLIIGLNFGLLVGLFAGLISFIPFVGSILGGALSIGIATFQFWDQPEMIGAVVITFVIGQAVEGNYLTPKLVGGSVGLHPVWLMFALSAFGALMGFTGLLIAVPTAAAIGVFSRYALEQYKSGRLYRGVGDHAEDDD